MRWPKDAQGWPMAEHSRFVTLPPHQWHVQQAGVGPTLLLLHGAGGATQSWRGLFPLLAADHHAIAPDLPGQGFTRTGARTRFGLAAMAEDLLTLAQSEGWQIDAIIGHSAGAAIALEMSLRMAPPGVPVIGLNAALSNFEGVSGWIFPALAKVLAATPFAADLFAATASSEANVRRLVSGTGSVLPPEALAFYQRLVRDRGHVDGTLGMMAQWQLAPLLAHLPEIDAPVLFLTGANDRAVPPETSDRAASRMPNATVERLPGLGHLMHEEDPATVAGKITDFLERIGKG